VWPDPRATDDEGLVGFGADLAVETLVDAYRHGIFPWPCDGVPLPWFSPSPRAVIEVGSAHVSRTLRRHLRACGWHTTVDVDVAAVVAGCADRPSGAPSWITRPMRRAYENLARRGWAHSLEVWDGPTLVGGIYGVRVGACFTGESMFGRVPAASKVALVDLVARWGEAGGAFVDAQLPTAHLTTMGAVALDRDVFLDRLAAVRDEAVLVSRARLAVSRLA